MARPNSQTRKVPTAKRSGPFVVKSDADVLGLRTLGALRDIKLDLLVLVEGLVAAGLDGGEVDEHVLASAVLRDEAENLVGVEPLDGSLSHDLFPCSVLGALCPKPLKTSICAGVQRTETRTTRYKPRLRPRQRRHV